MAGITNVEDALKNARELKQKIPKIENVYTLFYRYEDLRKRVPDWIKAAAICKTTGGTAGTVGDVAYELQDCLSVFKKQYVILMEKHLDEAEKGSLEKCMIDTADRDIKQNPAMKQFHLDDHKKDMQNFETMWALYDTIKSERNERASPVHKKLLAGLYERVLKYLESK